jgi:hypothetical protein
VAVELAAALDGQFSGLRERNRAAGIALAEDALVADVLIVG